MTKQKLIRLSLENIDAIEKSRSKMIKPDSRCGACVSANQWINEAVQMRIEKETA